MNTYALIVCSCPATGRAPTLTAAIAITTKIVLGGPRMLHWTYVGGIERALSGILASATPGTRRHARHAWRTSIPGRRGKRGPGRDWRGDIFACWNDVGVAEKRLGEVLRRFDAGRRPHLVPASSAM